MIQRRGHSLVLVLSMVSFLALSAGALTIDRVRSMRAHADRQVRLIAREWALGAAALAVGSEHSVGEWTLSHTRDDGDDVVLQASGPQGTYRIDAQGEHWRRRRTHDDTNQQVSPPAQAQP